jgi:hypothetical protein
LSASYADSAGFASTAANASFATVAGSATSASYANNAGNAATATSASFSTTSSYALTASYVLGAASASYAATASYADTFTVSGTLFAQTIHVQVITSSTELITGSLNVGGGITGSFSGSLNNLQGTATHIPYFSSSQVLADSAMYQVGNASIAINQDGVTTAAPEALYVWQPSNTSFNVISGKGNLDNYLQLNIQNTNQGVSASSDVVATANNGDENNNYINMGINSENFNGPIGEGNDAYLYSTGNNLHIGNTKAGKHVGFFVGGDNHETDNKLQLNSNNQHQMSGSLDASGSITATSFITRGATSTQFVKGDGSLDSTSYTPSSVFNSTTSSLQAFSASILNFTSSYYVTSGSVSNRIVALEQFSSSLDTTFATDADLNALSSSFVAYTSSLNNFSASVLSYTSSNNEAIAKLYAETSSLLANTASMNLFSASILSYTASSIIDSGSVSTRLVSLEQFSSSLDATFATDAQLNALSASFTAHTASINAFSASILSYTASNNATIADLLIETASLQAFSASILSFTASQQNSNGTFATTGSNVFRGNQTITGSLSVSGSTNLYGTTNITGSVNVSGSTGTLLTANVDTIVFTGSFNQSGSVSLNSSVDITGSLIVNGRNYINDSASFDTRINNVSSSFEASTTSLNAFSASILNYTASTNATIADILVETASLQAATASLNAFSASILSYTASNNATIADLLIETASLQAFSASMLSFTSSTLINSASFDTRINYLSSSFESSTSSLNSFTASFNAFSSSILNTTASINEFSASMLSFTASQKDANGAFATTGSNTFIGNQVISGSTSMTGSLSLTGSQNIIGNLTVTNTITAEKLVVQFITSSVAYVTGSTKFGDEVTDTHQFTGSVLVSGSLVVNGRDYIDDSGSFDTRINNISSSFEFSTASFNAFSASMLAYTASTNSTLADILNETASLQAVTASFNAFSASILSYTASNNATITKLYSETASLNAFSASILAFTASSLIDSASFDTRINYVSNSFEASTVSLNAFSSSILNYTASNNLFVADILTETASLQAATASLNLFSASILSFTASTLTDSASFDTRINYISSSFEAATASLNAFSASILNYTASINATLTDILVETASLQAFSASMLSFTASQNNLNGTFATTGSNTFVGNQIISGSLTVTQQSNLAFLTASGLHYPTTDGIVEQFLTTNGAGTLSFANARTLYQNIRNRESITIVKGTPLFVSGSTGDNADVFIADAANPSRMPVTLIAGDTLAPNAAGRGIILGHIEGVDTNAYPAGTEVYVAAGGGWTAIRPSGSAQVQPLGIVTRQGNNGMGIVLTVPPVVLPNTQTGYMWIGNGNQYPVQIATSSIQNVISSSYAGFAETIASGLNITASNLQVTNNTTIGGNLVVNGTASFNYVETVSGSAVVIGQEFIVLNTQLPAARFAGLKVYDSGSTNATASIVWDSQRNHLVYQNASGSSYSGGGFMSGPRNTGSLGDETYPTLNRVLRGQGGDHLYDSNIFDDNSLIRLEINTAVTGTLNVSNGITGSLLGNVVGDVTGNLTGNVNGNLIGTASYSSNADLLDGLDSTSFVSTGSFGAQTAIFNAFSASILNYTSSVNSTISAIYAETASIQAFSASMLSFTASQKNSNGIFATTGSNTFEGVQTINSNLVVTGSITAQTLVVQTITSSVDFVTGSTHFGTTLENTHQFTGSVSVSGSLSVNDSNVILTNQTASMSVATASYWSGSINNVLSASYALTASHATNVPETASFANNATSASYSLTASFALNVPETASFALTASYWSGSIRNAVSAAFADLATSASYSATASYALFAVNGGGGGGGGSTTTFQQATQAVTWSINHFLNTQTPVVQVYDDNFNTIIPTSISNPGAFQTFIYFEVSQSGYAILTTGGGLSVTGSNAVLNQTAAATTWSFNHNLQSLYPVFTIFDENDDVIIPQRIHAATTASAEIYFSTPRTGKAVASLAGFQSFISSSLSSSYATNADNAINAQSASYAGNYLLTSSFNTFSGSFITYSGSVNNRVVALENFSSSLDATFATDADVNAVSASLNAYTASTNAFSASILAYTASNNASIADILNETASLNAATASLYNFSASILAYTASNNAAISQLYAETASILAYTASNTTTISALYAQTASINAFSASILSFTSSYNTGSFTGSFVGTASFASNATSASFATTASYVSSNFQYEVHVSQVDGNDTTGNGDLLNPVASITKALTLIGGSRKTVIIHPGTYTESITVASTNTTISTSELTGANTLLSGTLTIGTLGSGTRISGLKMTNLVISGTAQAYISNCTVDTQVTKSSSGYVEIINSELQCISGIQISGAGTTIINGNKNVGVAVSNASAQVIIKGCNSVVTPSASAGNLAIVDCIVTALGGNGITITGALTTLTLLNSQVLVQAGNNVAPISVAGIYSIINTIYDKPGSTITGTSTNSVDYFQYIDADNITAKGLTITGSVTATQGFTGSLFGTSSWAQNATTASYILNAVSSSFATTATSASFANTASYADNFTVAGTLTAQTLVIQTITSSVIYSSGSNIFGNDLSNTQQLTGSVTVTGSLAVNGSNVVLTNQTASMSVTTASFASTASFTPNAIVSAVLDIPLNDTIEFTLGDGTTSLVTINNVGTASLATTASYWSGSINNALSASFASTASYWSGSIQNAVSAAFADLATSASFATTASYATYAANGGGGGISAIYIADEGILQGTASYFDFTGTGVSATVSSGTASISISGGGSGTQGLTTTFTQSSAAVSWSFTHNLNTRTPVVQVYDSGYNQITPQYISSSNTNEVVIGFGIATTGYAVISTGGALVVTGSNVILNQTASATTWSFNHGLNQQYPVFQVFNTDDEVIIPERIKAVDSASALIYFPTPVAGKAIASFAGLSGSIGGGSGAGFPFSGSAVITGSFLVSGSSVDFTQVSSFTGNLTGTASYATFALTASTAPGYTVQFSQTASAATWSFTHNMGTRNPIVQVYGSDYRQLLPNDIVGIDGSTVEVRFDYATTGYAILSNGGGLYITGSTSTLIQTSAATTWSFNHQLNTKYPAFEVYDENDLVIIPAGIKAIDVDNAEIYFAGAQAGRVIANFSGINGLQDNAVSASFASSGSVFHLDKVVMDRSLMDYAQVNSSIVGSNNMFTQATGSYTSMFVNYTVASGSNARSGQIIAVWNAGTTEYNDVSTNDIGDTTAVTGSVAIVTGEAQLNFQTNTSGWRIKSTATFM